MYAVLQNYQNEKGEAPTIKDFKRDSYKRVSDSFNVERYQAAPLYDPTTDKPVRYGRDGWLVRVKGSDTLARVPIAGVSFEGEYTVPKRYLRLISDSVQFNIINVVDVKNQNICTLEKVGKEWLVRSMNPVTSGRHKPPHAQETPTGLFVVQEHKSKMFYFEDGTRTYGGFAPMRPGLPLEHIFMVYRSIIRTVASSNTVKVWAQHLSHICVSEMRHLTLNLSINGQKTFPPWSLLLINNI
ncbi:hypothetical protein KUH03_37290 [Sphingobacterium sp. E70]|nr:hypothetical protein [Sphingobacterium sp. E70]ULT24549.1 hypothetical protein KUH03_37290 [Sphingobacterium sp. E70]